MVPRSDIQKAIRHAREVRTKGWGDWSKSEPQKLAEALETLGQAVLELHDRVGKS